MLWYNDRIEISVAFLVIVFPPWLRKCYCLGLTIKGSEGGFKKAMITFDAVIKKVWDVYFNRDKYAYLMGTKGFIVKNRAQFDEIVSWSPEHFARYTPEQLEQIFNYVKDKMCFDCSGFIYYLTGDYNYSANQWKNCTPNKSLAEGVAGSILYKPGHIGIDIGYGIFAHFPIEMKTIEFGRIRDYVWTNSGLHKNIDYTGSTNK